MAHPESAMNIAAAPAHRFPINKAHIAALADPTLLETDATLLRVAASKAEYWGVPRVRPKVLVRAFVSVLGIVWLPFTTAIKSIYLSLSRLFRIGVHDDPHGSIFDRGTRVPSTFRCSLLRNVQIREVIDFTGAGEGNRTLDTQLGKLMFCH